ncbi:MAG: hypothetical protein II453_02555 [Alphaproteobacteria bacterium]|nr:hypothetical protein [Alphaproteobacteria bacterium]
MNNYIKKDTILKIIKDWQEIDTVNKGSSDDIPIYSQQDWQDWKVDFYLDVINEIENLPSENVVSAERFERLLESANMLDQALRTYQDREEKLVDEILEKMDDEKMDSMTEMLDVFYAIKHLYKRIGGKEK